MTRSMPRLLHIKLFSPLAFLIHPLLVVVMVVLALASTSTLRSNGPQWLAKVHLYATKTSRVMGEVMDMAVTSIWVVLALLLCPVVPQAGHLVSTHGMLWFMHGRCRSVSLAATSLVPILVLHPSRLTLPLRHHSSLLASSSHHPPPLMFGTTRRCSPYWLPRMFHSLDRRPLSGSSILA
jgi:hypothetical protein